MGNKFTALEAALNMTLNMYIGKENRLLNLKAVEGYAAGLVHLTEEQRKLLGAVFQAFRLEVGKETVSEECIGGYMRILKDILNINRSLKGPKCIVFGDNWLAQEMKSRMRSMNYCVFDWHAANPLYADEYDLYLLCDEPLKVYDLPTEAQGDRLLKLWDYLKYKFVVFPAFYESCVEFKKQQGHKVKCIVTGGTNIKGAVKSGLLHTKTVSLANVSQDLFYDYHMFRRALSSLPELEYAVIGLEPFSLRYDESGSKVEWRRCMTYYPIIGTMHNCSGAEQLARLFEEEEKKLLQHFDRKYLDSLYDIYVSQTKPAAGAERVYDSAGMSRECEALILREISELYNRPFPETVEENRSILEEYVGLCAEKGIKAVLLIPPYTGWYREHMKMEYYGELRIFLDELARKYGAVLIDMLQMQLPDCCFSDYANVNCLGAVKVAAVINGVIDG